MMLAQQPSLAVQFLHTQPWFGDLSDDLRSRVLESVRTVQGRKGEVLLAAGEETTGWHAVLYGLVKLQTQSTEGRRQAFLGIPAGEWFGEGSALKGGPRPYDVIALRDTDMLCLPRAEFEAMRSTSLAFCQALIGQFNMRLGQALAVIETMRLRTPLQRVAMYLGPPLWQGSRRMSLSQEELGLLCGLARQTVNTVLGELEQRRLVSLEFGRIEVRDADGLRALIAGS
jgi:CRP/FNR family cyclic AMP-dependent transcriptional regulator